MKTNITVYPLSLNKMLDQKDESKLRQLIEKIGMTGAIPRPLFICSFYRTNKQTLVLIAGNVGNYNDRIIHWVEKDFDCNASFISDEEAQQIINKENVYL